MTSSNSLYIYEAGADNGRSLNNSPASFSTLDQNSPTSQNLGSAGEFNCWSSSSSLNGADFNPKQFIDSLVKSLVLSPEQAADLLQIAKVRSCLRHRLVEIYRDRGGVPD